MNQRFLSSIAMMISIFLISNLLFGQSASQPSFVQVIAEGTPENVMEMINSIADINTKINDLGWTPLHAAVSFRKDDLASMLVKELNANIDAQDNSGNTPLLIAVETGQINAVNFLIENEADVHIANNSGDNPLSIAQKIGLDNISNLLSENNAQLPAQNSQSQGQRGNRRGMMPGMNNMIPENFNNRRGPGGNEMNQDFANNQINQNRPVPEISVNSNETFINNDSGDLDPNEVQARINKYPGLNEEVVEVVNGRRNELRQWGRVDRDNRTGLISAIIKQYQNEVEFIQKIATEEKAKTTIEQAKNMNDSRKDAFIAINRAVRDQGTTSSQKSTSTRRTTSRTTTSRTTTRNNRRGSTTEQTNTSTQEEESKYSPEVQAEINVWLNADITGLSDRINLMESVNETITLEINSLKQTAVGEKAEKTIAAIDGLIFARKMGYDELNKELQETLIEQNNSNTNEVMDMPDYQDQETMNRRGSNRGQTMTTGRGTRGR
ncbi:MAG: ankyrin repeat domain-containing protein [Sedimentisphaerales bacterium]|nr:ankyrin repeat domain-containing protein [Sedimentisphaerales bacterium]